MQVRKEDGRVEEKQRIYDTFDEQKSADDNNDDSFKNFQEGRSIGP